MSDISKLGLGRIITSEQNRDAVHIAVAPVIAACTLHPGDRVGLKEGQASPKFPNHIGVVDPFLAFEVEKGQKFWLFLFPGSITGLRHDWTHPAFVGQIAPKLTPEEEIKLISEKWLRDYADRMGCDYIEMMDAAATHKIGNNWGKNQYICEGGRYEGVSVPEEFWLHFKNVTGIEGEGSFFSCSC